MARIAKSSSLQGKTPNKATFVIGSYNEKEAKTGNIITGGDLRGRPGKNAGKMPRSM